MLLTKNDKDIKSKDLIPKVRDVEEVSTTIPIYAVFAPDCVGYPSDYRFKMNKPNSGIAILCKPCTALFIALGLKKDDFYPCDCHKCTHR